MFRVLDWLLERGRASVQFSLFVLNREEVKPKRGRGLTAPNDETGDDVYYYNRWRLKLEGETENICVCTKERKGVSAEVLMATPCTNGL